MNSRPSDPQSDALAKLRYIPIVNAPFKNVSFEVFFKGKKQNKDIYFENADKKALLDLKKCEIKGRLHKFIFSSYLQSVKSKLR